MRSDKITAKLKAANAVHAESPVRLPQPGLPKDTLLPRAETSMIAVSKCSTVWTQRYV